MSKPVVVLVVLLFVMVLFGLWVPAYNHCRRFGGGRVACAATVFPWGEAQVYR